jgi:hypothetical protein
METRVRLPRALVAEAERVGEDDPEALKRLLAYGVTRRAIFEHLLARGGPVEPETGGAY